MSMLFKCHMKNVNIIVVILYMIVVMVVLLESNKNIFGTFENNNKHWPGLISLAMQQGCVGFEGHSRSLFP